jgi:tripartite-type tricarboxylate transporter receptor subunit TctC
MEETVVRTARAIALIAFATLGLLASGAMAEYPERPIRLIYPYTAGGAGDALARLFADRLGPELGQQMIVDNRPGAGGNTGAVAAAAAAADGYTLFSVSPAFAINASLFAAPGYDPVKDFIPVTPLSVVPNVLVVSAALPVRSVQELVAYARANPGKVNFGSSGIGTSIHLAGEMLKREAKIDIVHVPYRGSAQAGTDLLGGQLQMMFDSAPTALSNVRTGRAVAIAASGMLSWPASVGSCAITWPPAAWMARTPSAPSAPLPDSTITTTRKSGSCDNDANRKSIGSRGPRFFSAAVRRTTPSFTAMRPPAGITCTRSGSSGMSWLTSTTGIGVRAPSSSARMEG